LTFEILADQAAHDLQSQAPLAVRIEIRRQAAPEYWMNASRCGVVCNPCLPYWPLIVIV